MNESNWRSQAYQGRTYSQAYGYNEVPPYGRPYESLDANRFGPPHDRSGAQAGSSAGESGSDSGGGSGR
jgi:hypothetical protein